MFRRIAPALVSCALALVLACVATTARAVSTPTSVTLTWTAPGDDSLSGTATQYDVRYATAPITGANFAAAQSATGAPVPLAAGTTQSMLVSGLTPGTTYWFALKTTDEASNWSGVSNIVQWTTPTAGDTLRPAALAVAVTATTGSSVTLGWSAVGDDSLTGTATQYEVRWSAAPITPANWSAATLVATGVPTPAASGVSQSCTIGGLNRSIDLWFAARVRDEADNWSALSNVPQVARVLDTAPPAAPGGLAVGKQSDGVHVAWSANAEPDLAGYHVYRAVAAGGTYTRLDATLLTTNAFVDASAPDSSSLWYAVTAVDASQNESARSAPFQLSLRGTPIAAVRLQPVFPNPSSLSQAVTLPVEVPAGSALDGHITILDAAGQRVRTIELRGVAPGTTSVSWDGRNDAGHATAPGVYRALLHLGGADQIMKLVRRP